MGKETSFTNAVGKLLTQMETSYTNAVGKTEYLHAKEWN